MYMGSRALNPMETEKRMTGYEKGETLYWAENLLTDWLESIPSDDHFQVYRVLMEKAWTEIVLFQVD